MVHVKLISQLFILKIGTVSIAAFCKENVSKKTYVRQLWRHRHKATASNGLNEIPNALGYDEENDKVIKDIFLAPPTSSSSSSSVVENTTGSISKNVANALDLPSILDMFARFCVTDLGKESAQSLVEEKRRAFYDDIFHVANSQEECREEYARVKEAMQIISESGKKPPFLKWKRYEYNESGKDVWLWEALVGKIAFLGLEHVQRASYITSVAISTIRWSMDNNFEAECPHLFQECLKLQSYYKNIALLHHHISDSVVEEYTRSTSTFTNEVKLGLNLSKYPKLMNLRSQENLLKNSIMATVRDLLKSESIRSKLARNPDGSIPDDIIEIDGRFLLPVPQNYAASIGKIRDRSRSQKTCYVEPHEISDEIIELTSIREDIVETEKRIVAELSRKILENIPLIWNTMIKLSRLDLIFAKASFGENLDGQCPIVDDEGTIYVEDFIHPFFAMQSRIVEKKVVNPVPIDLKLCNSDCNSALVISGVNGGGKTAALKSFGIATIFCKLGIPIIGTKRSMMRVDFFDDIFADVGDSQNLIEGTSTLMARMVNIAAILERMRGNVSELSSRKKKVLFLADEAGTGTDPMAGYAITRSIWEYILDLDDGARIVATTHSPQLKLLSMNDERFTSASVLLGNGLSNSGGLNDPAFKLTYNSIGDSNALSAVARCNFPDEILSRATELLGTNNEHITEATSLVEILEQEKEASKIMVEKAESLLKDSREIFQKTANVASSYEKKLARIENRLNSIFAKLKADENVGSLNLVGTTLQHVRLDRKRVQTQTEMLRNRGLKLVPFSYQFSLREMVVILAEPYDGETGYVVNQVANKVFVEPAFTSSLQTIEFEASGESNLKLGIDEVAIWDDNEGNDDYLVQARSDSYKGLENLFSKISSNTSPQPSKSASNKKLSKGKFTSSRARKAAAKKRKKK